MTNNMPMAYCGACNIGFATVEEYDVHIKSGHTTPEAETGGELRELLLIAFGQLMMTADTYPTNGQLVDAALRQFAAHTRRAVLLGKLDEQYRIGTGSLITGALGIVYFNEDGSTYKSQDDRIKTLKAELKEIELL